jgi:peptidase M1-like protein
MVPERARRNQCTWRAGVDPKASVTRGCRSPGLDRAFEGQSGKWACPARTWEKKQATGAICFVTQIAIWSVRCMDESPTRTRGARSWLWLSLSALCTLGWSAVREPARVDARQAPAPVSTPTPVSAPAQATAPAIARVDANADIPLASAHAAAVEVPSAPDAWGGPRTGNEATLSDRVVKYEIVATLDPRAHTIDAEQKLTWRNRSDRNVSSLYLHLYLNAFEGSDSTFFSESRDRGLSFRSNLEIGDGEWGHIQLSRVEQNGVNVPWAFVQPDGGPSSDHTVVRLDLPTPVAPGASTRVDMAFHDQLPRVIARTGWFGSFHMVAQWFPKIGVLELPGERGATQPRWNVHEFHPFSEFYADFADYDVQISVPKGFQVAAAGLEQGPPQERGELVMHRFVQGDIHDFAWMAVDNFAPPLEGTYSGPGSPEVKVKVFYPREYAASAAPALQATLDSLRYFSETLGPYPYPTSTCIIPPFNAAEAGGMEYQTLFTAMGFSKLEPDTLNSAMLDFVTIHEFGHGYFYGLLASNEFEEPLLDEGLNEYWDQRMLRQRGQSYHLTTSLLRRLGIDPSVSGFELERAGGAVLDQRPADPIGENAWDRLSTTSYGQVYSRTATVMHDLEERLGSPVIEQAFRAYYAKWRFRHPSTADLREALVEASGDRATVEQVFRQNVYGVHAIDDRVENLISQEELPAPGTHFEGGQWVERTKAAVEQSIKDTREEHKQLNRDAKDAAGPYLYRTTVTVRRDGASVPQTLVVHFADHSSATARWDDDRLWQRFTFLNPYRATSAELDPERRILLDNAKLNDARTIEANGAASRRWTGDLAAALQVVCSLLGAL